jgi:hypothetical protein
MLRSVPAAEILLHHLLSRLTQIERRASASQNLGVANELHRLYSNTLPAQDLDWQGTTRRTGELYGIQAARRTGEASRLGGRSNPDGVPHKPAGPRNRLVVPQTSSGNPGSGATRNDAGFSALEKLIALPEKATRAPREVVLPWMSRPRRGQTRKAALQACRPAEKLAEPWIRGTRHPASVPALPAR